MQELIDEAVIMGKLIYEEEQQKKDAEKGAMSAREKIRRAALQPLVLQWITEELPDLVKEAVSKAPDRTEIRLYTINYKNKLLEADMLLEGCIKLGLNTRVETGTMKYYDEGPEEDYVHYYVIFEAKK